ncbi:MAG: cytochrome c oxidase subunit 3 [Phycisphaerales bacterium]|nr:cytochrome c oxidase subunit 3 [Hyphomonadaceae bacterium]
MAHGEVKHDYHLVNPSPWPFVASVGAFLAAVGAVVLMRGLSANDSDFFFGRGQWTLFLVGMGVLIVTCIAWWGDVIKESRAGDHTPVVDIGLRYGMILFIASEVMFFVAWFWVFFEMTIFHEARSTWMVPTWDPETAAAWASWPPPHVETFDPFHLPLINTLILLLSGTTVTWAHHAVQQGDRNGARLGLLLTVLLGVLFSWVQFGVEYPEAGFAFGNPEGIGNATVYGASFFMATGFHGFHVIIGTIFLAVCLLRVLRGGFTPQKHFGLEAAAWYWHFVDVVWLFLFTFVYVMPYLTMQN